MAIARKVLGDDIGIIVDANGNYTVDEALDSMRRIAHYRIEWYEEPLPPLAFDGYAVLRPRAPILDRDGLGALHCLVIWAPSTSCRPT